MKTVNLGNIKYIFQIPLDWFKRAHNACFNSFGEDFIVVDHQDDGTNKIGINEQDFASKVEQYAGGKVKTVDGHEPDESGDVSFGLVTNKVVVTDGAGHLTTTDVEYATKDYVDYEDSVILEKVDTAVKVANSAGKVAGEAKASAAAAETTASAASAAAATADLHAG